MDEYKSGDVIKIVCPKCGGHGNIPIMRTKCKKCKGKGYIKDVIP